jgi:non-heme chloroperoxidase
LTWVLRSTKVTRVRRSVMTAGLGGAAYGIARSRAGWILRQPDRYPIERLRHEPVGGQVAVVRPDGSRIRAVSAGVGPPVVLAHGFYLSLIEWAVVWDALLDLGCQVIAFDQRGHGQSSIGSDGVGPASMADDYLAILDHFDVHDGILVGHSLGGFLAIQLLLDHPEVALRLRGLVLCGANAGRILQGSLENRLRVPLLRWRILQRAAATRTGGQLFGASMEGDTPSPAEISLFLDVFLRQDHHSMVRVLDAVVGADNYARLGEIGLPTVVICGDKDRVVPPFHSTLLVDALSDARLVSLRGRGHMLNWEAPEAIVEAVRGFAPRMS